MPNKFMKTDQRNLKLEAIQRERKSLLKNRNHFQRKIKNLISKEVAAAEEEEIQDILKMFQRQTQMFLMKRK